MVAWVSAAVVCIFLPKWCESFSATGPSTRRRPSICHRRIPSARARSPVSDGVEDEAVLSGYDRKQGDEGVIDADAVEKLLIVRCAARRVQDWTAADAIRDTLGG